MKPKHRLCRCRAVTAGPCRKAQSPLSCIHPQRSCRRPGEEPLQSSRPVGLLRYPARDFKRRARHSDSLSRRFQLKQVRCPPRLAQRQLKRKPTTRDLESAVRKLQWALCQRHSSAGSADADDQRGGTDSRVPLSSSAGQSGHERRVCLQRLKNGVFKTCYRPMCRLF